MTDSVLGPSGILNCIHWARVLLMNFAIYPIYTSSTLLLCVRFFLDYSINSNVNTLVFTDSQIIMKIMRVCVDIASFRSIILS
jgi:hypothetical protein